MKMICHCGNTKKYSECCRPFLIGVRHPRTPQELMRSRYCAYKVGNAKYIFDTLHQSKRNPSVLTHIHLTLKETQFIGLKVISSQNKNTHGTVEFAAFYKGGQIHEKSTFVFEAGKWYYVDGEQLPLITLSKNEVCICGSGKKYKRCCAGLGQ